MAHLAGVDDITDHKAIASGLPPVDSLNVWDLVIGTNKTSPRETILVNQGLLVHKNWK